MNFLLPMIYLFSVGLFFNDRSNSSRFMNEDQKNEWKGEPLKCVSFVFIFAYIKIFVYNKYAYVNIYKILCTKCICLVIGWMILVILIYHITGGDKHLPLYMHIRVLISSYIFLIGYEHFQYFWRLPHNSPERNKMLFIRFMQVGKVFIQ